MGSFYCWKGVSMVAFTEGVGREVVLGCGGVVGCLGSGLGWLAVLVGLGSGWLAG